MVIDDVRVLLTSFVLLVSLLVVELACRCRSSVRVFLLTSLCYGCVVIVVVADGTAVVAVVAAGCVVLLDRGRLECHGQRLLIIAVGMWVCLLFLLFLLGQGTVSYRTAVVVVIVVVVAGLSVVPAVCT